LCIPGYPFGPTEQLECVVTRSDSDNEAAVTELERIVYGLFERS